MHEFDPNLCGDTMKLSNNNKSITGGRELQTCYGKQIISSINNGIYIWKLKICGDSGNIWIGIDNAKGLWIHKYFHTLSNRSKYAYNTSSGLLLYRQGRDIKNLPKFKNNDILTMKLIFNDDNDGGILTVKKNNEKEVIASTKPSSKIARGDHKKYRFAVSVPYGNFVHIL